MAQKNSGMGPVNAREAHGAGKQPYRPGKTYRDKLSGAWAKGIRNRQQRRQENRTRAGKI